MWVDLARFARGVKGHLDNDSMDAGVFVEIGHLCEKFRFRYGPADVSVLISSVFYSTISRQLQAVVTSTYLPKILSSKNFLAELVRKST